MSASYRSRTWLPPLVRAAEQLANEQGFDASCSPEVGRLLAVLAANCRGTIGEMGTGTGVGTAWLLSGRPRGPLWTVDVDPSRAGAVSTLIRGHERAHVLTGDWTLLLEHGPFDLLFVDAGPPKREDPNSVIESLPPGGMVVLDDFTPESRWPESWRGQPDPIRALWLDDDRLMATELTVSLDMQVIVAVRR